MKKLIVSLYKKCRHLILYGIIGLFSSSVDFLVYTVLVYVVGLQYILANNVGVLVGIAISFFLNRNFNFRTKEKTIRRFAIFLLVGLTGMLASDVILYGCTSGLHLGKMVSKAISVVTVALFQFLFNKYVTFKPSN